MTTRSTVAVKTFAVILGALMALAAPTAALASVLPIYEGASPSHLRAKPSSIWLSGDGTSELAGWHGTQVKRSGSIKWTNWSDQSAYGFGANWLNNCIPDCADGTFTGFRVNLHAYRPVWSQGRGVFTRLTITYSHSLPKFWGYRKRTYHATVTGSYDSYDGNFYFYYNNW